MSALQSEVDSSKSDKTWQEFVADHIRSVEHLEVLMLFEQEPAREWSARDVYSRIQSNLASVTRRLEELVASGFIEGSLDPPTYRYAPRSEKLSTGMEALAEAYRKKPIKVIALIFAQPSPHLRAFSDTFKFNPPPESNG